MTGATRSRWAIALGLAGSALLGCAPTPPMPAAPAPPPEVPAAPSEPQAEPAVPPLPPEPDVDQRYPIIPAPARLEPRPGAFALTRATRIVVSNPADAELGTLATRLAGVIADETGLRLAPPASRADSIAAIALRLDDSRSPPDSEAYRLRVEPNGIEIVARTHAGLFYGIQTLRQLISAAPQTADEVAVPAVEIEDAPRFPYRGMHLDVGRHLFPVAFIKRYIDLMSMFKMNTFHWHLTDDQGWRIQIHRYPRLTAVGSCRTETVVAKNFDPYIGDSIPYCGFYTQDEIRDVVAYARARYVTVIPEIEMPGHSMAALASYPQLACTPGPFAVGTRWGVYPDIYCPTESTFTFLENVLSEVMDLFPSRYIHIGGDEAPKVRWHASAVAQAIMRREGLADEQELQSWFIRRIERFLVAHGRRLIGWDEILEGGLAPEATVMSWRGMAGGIEAARQGHDVIMTPGSHVYFDYYQGDPAQEPFAIGGFSPLEHVYAFEPVPDSLTPEEARHVLGAQGNVWTEYMATTDYVEYMVFPRLLALAEVVWSPADRREWSSFAARLPASLRLLDQHGVHYRVPDVGGLAADSLTLHDHVTVSLASLVDGEIHYTVDGSEPTSDSPTYDGPLSLPVDTEGVTVSARVVLPDGRQSAVRSATYRRAELAPAVDAPGGDLAPGLAYRYFKGRIGSTTALSSLTVTRTGVASAVALPGDAADERFALEFDGYLTVPSDGVYTFRLTSDDGSVLRIDGHTVVDHDGPHGESTRTGMVALAQGLHRVSVRYFQAGGGKALDLVCVDDHGEELPLAGRLLHTP